MTAEDVARVEEALALIEAQAPEVVYARRKGVVIGVAVKGKERVVFRRIGGGVRAEFWHANRNPYGDRCRTESLGPHLAAKAAALLDR